jgi:hypothetical protein
MKSKILVIAILSAAIALAGLSFSAQVADAQQIRKSRLTDVQAFYQQLAPYGRWFSMSPYGSVWSPYGIAADWRPYTNGEWIYTDDGWTWLSDDNWGWATDHYGRWFFDTLYGWVWVPDTVWSPAWVSWRYGNGWIGWAPLSPMSIWGPGGFADPVYDSVPVSWYSFVRQDVFVQHHIKRFIALPDQNQTLVRVTDKVTHYTLINGQVVNRSVSRQTIERVIGQKIPKRRVEDVGSAATLDSLKGQRVKGDKVLMYRPTPTASPSASSASSSIDSSTDLGREQKRERKLEAEQSAAARKLERRQSAEQEQMTREQQKAEQRSLNEQAREQERMTRKQERRQEMQMPPNISPAPMPMPTPSRKHHG